MALKEYLQQQYQGRESFLTNVVFPMFGEDLFEDGYNESVLGIKPELIPLAQSSGIESILRIGTINVDFNPIDIYDITVSDKVQMQRNRVSIQMLIRRIMDTYSSSFMIFHYKDNSSWDWRFTFCSKKGNNEESTDSKRYTFLLGPNQSCRTAAENFEKLIKIEDKESITVESIISAFDVEALSREFFGKYKEHYSKFVSYMCDEANGMRNNFIDSNFDKAGLDAAEIKDKEEKPIRDYVKRLLGRIVFLHFLQKKGWMGVPVGKEWGEGDKDFMMSLYEKASESQRANFLDEILEPLFSEALNTDRTSNGDLFDIKVNLSCGSTIRIPYLNGGLFERDKYDEPKTVFPSSYFKDLLEFFYQYNFTIDENDPNDAQVGVDPEMLGRIFENLLEDNKDKGAFYTPKEIVQYMCRQALVAYLQTDEDDTVKSQIEIFVATYDVSEIGGAESDLARTIDSKLKEVKICDPAIGSGAFPMGLLKELFLCRGAIENFDNASEIKKHIIQNNIYGVDIEKGAVDIARLRFWLSLIVDEDTPNALPNLDYKIMQGNSLLESYKGVDLSQLTVNKQEISEGYQLTFFEDESDLQRLNLRNLLDEYYNCPDHNGKIELKKKISGCIQSQLDCLNLSNQGKYGEDTIDLSKIDIAGNDQFFLWHTWFSDVFNRPNERNGFDIVIGNPPFVVTKKKDYPMYKWNTDLFKMFFELAIHKLTRPYGQIVLITPRYYLVNKEDYDMRLFFLNNISINFLATCNPFQNVVTENVITMLTLAKSTDSIPTFTYDIQKRAFIKILPVDSSYCRDNLYCEVHIGMSQGVIDLLNKMKCGTKPLSYFTVSKRGAEISKKNLRQHTTDGIKSLIGKDVKKYEILWANTYLERSNDEYQRLKEFFNQPLIYLRRVDSCLEAAYSTNGYAYNKNIYGIAKRADTEYNLLFILGVINSTAANYYYKHRFSLKKEDAFPEIQTYLYEQLPIPRASEADQLIVEKLVSDLLAGTDDFAVKYEMLDKIIYRLYGLSAFDVSLIEQG